MDATEFLDLPTLALRLELPAGWQVDDSGLSHGSIVVWDPVDWTDGFQANLVLTQAGLTGDAGSGARGLPEHGGTHSAGITGESAG